jgi:streptogramin lyase
VSWTAFTAMLAMEIVLVTGTPAFAAPPITEYPIPTANSNPDVITAGPDGNLWFTELSANKIGRITPQGLITEFTIPTANSQPFGITAGPDGNVWFTEIAGNRIGRISPTGVIVEYLIPTPGASPVGITLGPDGNLWFTEYGAKRVGKITPGGVITEYVVSTSCCSHPGNIAAGPDGNLWFTDQLTIGQLTPDGVVIHSFGVHSGLSEIIAGPDGNLWFTWFYLAAPGEGCNEGVGKLSTSGNRTEYQIFADCATSPRITAGPDGNLWVTAANIRRVTPSGIITAYPVSTSTAPIGITTGPDGNIWFTEFDGNNIGKFSIPKAIVYKPLEPCRIMDTRIASQDSGVQGPIVGDTLYNFPGFIATGSDWSLFGGSAASDCGLNDTVGVNIQAIAMVITILNPNFDAFLGVGDVNDLNTTLSTVALNYTAEQGLSTMYIVPQSTSNTIYFALPTDLSANLVFDVVGYFVTSDATALQCTTQASAPSTISASGGTGSATSPACGASYTLTSGSCDSDSFAMKLVSDKASGQTWFCSAVNSGGTDAHLTATANCCRVAGK